MSITPPPLLLDAETFFCQAITKGFLAHAYILKGRNTEAMYQLVLDIAKVLHCQSPPTLPRKGGGDFSPPLMNGNGIKRKLSEGYCGHCADCRWIAENAHPDVLTISRMTYQVKDPKSEHELATLLDPDALEKMAEKPSWPTKIKTAQVACLIHQLGKSSNSVRVVIFTDSEELPAETAPSRIPAPAEWKMLEATQERSFHIRTLTRSIFNEASVNRFLKTLEEPPAQTLFFFITENESHLLETVVSRCQVIPYLTSNGENESKPNRLSQESETFMSVFLHQLEQGEDAYKLLSTFENFFVQEKGIHLSQGLQFFQQSLRKSLDAQEFNAEAFALYHSRQQKIEAALKRLDAFVHPQHVLLELFLSWT